MNKLTVKIITDANADARLNDAAIYRVNTLYLHAFIAERAVINRNTYPSMVSTHHHLSGNVLEDIKGLKLDPYHLNGVYAQRDFINPLEVVLDACGNIRSIAALDMHVSRYTYQQFADDLHRCIRKNVTMLIVTHQSTTGDAQYALEVL